LKDVHRVSEDIYQQRIRRATPKPGDLILAREAPAGNVAIVREDQQVCLGQRTVHLRPNKKHVDPDYLCYYLLAPGQQGRLLAGETGATARHVNMADIRKLKVDNLPELKVQHKIGQFLAKVDDLIANNSERIALLEDAARQIYKEWFVRLRFPGYEKLKIEDGIPRGWERKPVNQIAKIMSGGTPRTTKGEYWDGEIPFFTPKDIVDHTFVLRTERTITEDGLRNCNSALFEPGTIFITARGTVGALNIAAVPMAMSQSSFALKGNDGIGTYFLYSALQANTEQFKQHAVGAVFDAIVLDAFKAARILMPTNQLFDLFEAKVSPMFNQILNLLQQSERLKMARDLLLPRLMSGKVTI
jgi:type I restriction enzyme S subunit